MIRAFYTTSSSMVAQTIKQDTITNNIANAQTPGFKRERQVAASFAQALDSQIMKTPFPERPPYPNSAVQPIMVRSEQAADSTEGPIINTGSTFDFAIDGAGEFEVSNGSSTILTRNGSFRLNETGDLVTQDGANVMGQTGPIKIVGSEWSVGRDGTVFIKNAPVDKIKIVGSDAKTQVMQGCIEQSNVNIVREMVDMIANMRSYEANQKVLSNIDQTLGKMINEGGRV